METVKDFASPVVFWLNLALVILNCYIYVKLLQLVKEMRDYINDQTSS